MAKKKTVKPASRNIKKTKSKKKTSKSKIVNKTRESLFVRLFTRRNVSVFVIFMVGVLLIFSSYAWFSTSLNVKIKEFNMIVSKNSGLSISFDGINFGQSIEISRDTLINSLTKTYPNHNNQWATNGLTPVSTNGISNSNSYFFDIFESSGIRYKNKKNLKVLHGKGAFIYSNHVGISDVFKFQSLVFWKKVNIIGYSDTRFNNIAAARALTEYRSAKGTLPVSAGGLPAGWHSNAF